MGTRERRERSNSVDAELIGLFRAAQTLSGTAKVTLVAVGGYGNGELSPGSDIDILILHDGSLTENDLSGFVNALLYPLWDSGRAVDHSVRTRAQTRETATSDVKVAMGLLDSRFICGDRDLFEVTANDANEEWRKNAKRYIPQIRELSRERSNRVGELAYLLEPDLKEARGGLRDITALRAIAKSGLVAITFDRISNAESILRNVRDALHVESGRNRDQLRFVEQDKVARNLNYKDADELMSEVAKAARAVDYLLELTWHRLDQIQSKRFFNREKTVRVERGLVIEGGELRIESGYEITADPIVGLRAAAAAAQLGIPLSIDTCIQLAAELPPMPIPWPRVAREELVTLIGAGANMVRVWEALDQEGLIQKWIPEWTHLRSLPQRNVLHRHTVDRHMVETAVHAAALTRTVHRPDLLLFAALFHDVGKGFPDHDHSDFGATLMAPLAERLGFDSADVETLILLVKEHLLLSAIATRRDLDDPATISSVIEKIPSAELLELLHALSVADGEATGRAAWSDWKATLVSNLVNRCNAALEGIMPANQLELTDIQIRAAEAGELKVDLIEKEGEYLVEIIAPDSTGLLATIAGVLSITRFDVRSARTRSHGKSAVMTWVALLDDHVSPPTPRKLLELIQSGLAGQINFSEKIADRVKNYQKFPGIPVPPPVVTAIMDATTQATVIEVRMHDRPGLLYTIATAVTSAKIDIKAAIVSTLGAEAFDTLYVTQVDGSPLGSERAIEFARGLEARLK